MEPNKNIDFMQILFDFKRRKAEGLIKVEPEAPGILKITVIQKHAFETDKIIAEHSQFFSAQQIEKLALDKEEKLIQIRREKLTAMQNFDAQIADVEKRAEIFDLILEEIKKADKEADKEERKKEK